MKLREYQRQAHFCIFDAIEWEYRSVLVTSATGTGKTVLFAEVVKTLVADGRNILVLAPRRELINQAYCKTRDMCDLREEYGEIDKEMGNCRFDARKAKVVIGSIQTCYRPDRLQGWTPDVIICDEAHFCHSPQWRQLFDRFPDAIKIGFTATAMRGDRAPVFYENIDGSKTEVEERGKVREAKPEECAFWRHVYDYPLQDAVEDGWLVEPRGYSVQTGVDISGVKSQRNLDGDKDFSQAGLIQVLTKTDKIVVDRINRAITQWREVAADRPTVVFCPSVPYAHWAADLWRQAGYTAAAIDCNTPTAERDAHLGAVRRGEVQVTCNFSIFTHGTDVPEWSCLVMLRPTESAGLFSQCVGRITRPAEAIAGLLGDLATPEERRALIAASGKPDSIVIDAVDIAGKHALATLPSTLGLPAKIDFQGHKLTEAAALLREFDGVKKQVLFSCPATFEELKSALQRIHLLTNSGAAKRDQWLVTEDGSFAYGKSAPGYAATLTRMSGNRERWQLRVTQGKEEVYSKVVPRTQGTLADYFDSAANRVSEVIRGHQQTHRNTLARLSNKQLYHLRAAKFNMEDVDQMEYRQVCAIVADLSRKYHERKAQAQAAALGGV